MGTLSDVEGKRARSWKLVAEQLLSCSARLARDFQYKLTACYELLGSGSPDLDAFIRSEVELLVRLNVEGLVPLVLVADFEDAPVIGRVRIGEDFIAQRRGAQLGRP